MLASCVQCAVAAELQRRLLSIEQQELPHPAVRILLLAEECQRFMQAQDQDFLPLLAEHLPNVGQVAALRVHQVHGEQLLPWLRTGASGGTLAPASCLDGGMLRPGHMRSMQSTGLQHRSRSAC